MKKILVLGALCSLMPTFASGRGGGESFAGGMAGGMFGGLMSGAMTRGSEPRSKSLSASVLRELDKLENAVRYDLVKIDERIRTLERSSGRDGAGDSEELKQDITSVKKSLKKVESNLEHKIEALEDHVSAVEKRVKSVETKIKKMENVDVVEPVTAKPAKSLEKRKAPVEVPVDPVVD